MQIGLLVVGMAGAYFKFDSRIERAEDNYAAINRRTDALEEYLRRVDREGTQFSRSGIKEDSALVQANTTRIAALETSMNKLIPMTERMATNMEWITGWVKAQAQQPPNQTARK